MRSLRLLVGAAGLTLAAASLAGCSDSGSDKPDAAETAASSHSTSSSSTATEPPSSTAATPTASAEQTLETAYRTYVDAFLTGDGATAYALLSDKCQEDQPLSEFAAISEEAADVYGKVAYTIESIDISGDRGKVNATYPVEALNQGGGSEWVLQAGEWRMDRC